MTPRRLVAPIAAGFALGAASHAIDVAQRGWPPYDFGPAALNLFWNALLPIDLALVALLLRRPRLALPLATAVMAADVAANGYAWRVMRIDAFAGAVPWQAAFLLYVAGVTVADRRRARSA